MQKQPRPSIPIFAASHGSDAVKGRGTAWAAPHRFSRHTIETFDDGWGTLEQGAQERALPPRTQIIEEHAKAILTSNDSPDIAFDLSINPYRGCEHGCVYCFARPTHSYLNLSPGLDFETRIVAKVNAAQRLREAFASRAYEPAMLNLGSATDAYQPVERRLRITRGIVEVLAECSHAFSLVTKSAGVERDLDLLAPMAARGLVAAYVSITTLDADLTRILEPRAASPQRRLRTIETLVAAGVPVGVSVSPIIPFINEPELERILDAAAQAGATRAFSVVLRLPWEVTRSSSSGWSVTFRSARRASWHACERCEAGVTTTRASARAWSGRACGRNCSGSASTRRRRGWV